MSEDKQETSRRDVLKYSVAGVAGAMAIAGCKQSSDADKVVNPGN